MSQINDPNKDIHYQVIPHNARVYMDVAKDMFKKETGLFTFIIKIDGKKICDYVELETVQYERRSNS